MNDFMIVGDTLILYQGAASGVIVPAALTKEMPLRRIGKQAFTQNQFVRQITIPEGVTSIGTAAFANCSVLQKISLPATLQEIEIPNRLVSNTPALEILEFHCVLTQKELHALRATSIVYPYGFRVVQDAGLIHEHLPYLANILVSAGAEQPNLPAGDLPPLLLTPYQPGTPVSLPRSGRNLEYMDSRTLRKEADEVGLFMENMTDASQDKWLERISEEENDLYIRSDKEKPYQKTALFLLHDGEIRREGNRYCVPITVRIRYYFWQSSQKVVVSGIHYYIYRRHYLSGRERMQYIREDVAVFDSLGVMMDRNRAEEVYAKYRLSSMF
ncbi:MAG: leucine-rich repeat protein [Lachnospiraceae bacterium]|nr:leucine-rich repeat protein [Lachnospiraceae bacterium]